MKTISFYTELYRLLENTTPLRFDCGRLCGAACCRVSPELPGMYLFPGEEELLRGAPGFALSDAELPGWRSVRLLSCAGTCDRDFRPLSCRIFPLAPKVTGDAVHAQLDPRGKAVCPLCLGPESALTSEFVKAVEAVFAELLAEPETAGFLRAVALEADRYGEGIL
jgi:hypothetical protein